MYAVIVLIFFVHASIYFSIYNTPNMIKSEIIKYTIITDNETRDETIVGFDVLKLTWRN